MANDAAKCIDGEIEREFNKTPIRYVGATTTTNTITTNSTPSGNNNSVLNSFHVRKMRLELEKRNVPTFDGDYVMILSLEGYESLEGAIESVSQYTETGFRGKIMNGEIGRMHGVRFVKDGYATRFTYDSTAKTSTAKSWTNSKSLEGYMFGRPTVKQGIVTPEQIRAKVVTDYGRSHGLAWYMLAGWAIAWPGEANARIIKWDSAA